MKRLRRVQRLARYEEKAVVSRIFWLSIISLILVAVIFTVGLNFLGNFADFLNSTFGGDDTKKTSDSAILSPPLIDSIPDFTKDNLINVSGFASGAQTVEIYLNLNKVDQVETEGSKFEFKNFRLNLGENRISLKAVDNGGHSSDFSEEVIVILDNEEPKLEVETPSDDQHFSGNNRVKVLGKTEPDAQIFANGFLANVDFEGKFEVIVPLDNEGENKIEVKAQDEAGNLTIKEIKVHYSK